MLGRPVDETSPLRLRLSPEARRPLLRAMLQLVNGSPTSYGLPKPPYAPGRGPLIATTEQTRSPMLMPPMPAADYIKVDLSAVGGPEAWSKPVSAYFRRNSAGWTLVGFERLP